MEPDLCRGWTRSDVEELLAMCTDGERTVLETMARHPVTTRSELIESVGPGPSRSVDGYLGNLGKRAYKLGVTDAEGNVSWPFFIEADASSGESRYRMPDEVAEVIAPGSRRT